ncbi:hypothetical protein DJ030_03405 [bacterium endosymbiont of Escarpia laminata]|nr:MAG: hypothetical protein DJ030_03405 [bacterium endosymbiont of Escarpia laminata]
MATSQDQVVSGAVESASRLGSMRPILGLSMSGSRVKSAKCCFLTLFILCASLLTSGCTTNSPKSIGPQVIYDDGGEVYGGITLPASRIAEIRQAFIGRSFIFQQDWYEYSLIDSDPEGGFDTPIPITKFTNRIEKSGYRNLVAPAGTVAKIIGTRTYRDVMTFICETEAGEKTYLVILNHRPSTLFFGKRNIGRLVQRRALDVELTTIPWIERNLTFSTVKFVENLPEVPNTALALPEPPDELVLSPSKTAAATLTSAVTPSVSQLSTRAVPAQVRHGEVLKLLIDYTVDTAGQESLEVTESRSLLFSGKVLPGYPKERNLLKSSGRQTSAFRQKIPSQAKPGTYTYKGEVCIETGCVSRLVRFTIEP